MEIRSEDVVIPMAGGHSMGAYCARPDDDGPRPAVLVFMEIFGVNAHLRDVADRVACEGYVALAPDYFHRTGPGAEFAYDEAGMALGMERLGALTADEMVADIHGAVDYLRSQPGVRGDRIGAIGFCIGGHMAYLAACESDIQAAASFYGGGITAAKGPGGGASTLSKSPGIKGRVLCFFGGQDAMIPKGQVTKIRAALKAAGPQHEVRVYPEADHGFHCDQRPSYHEESAKDAWARSCALFVETLGD
jgi:carboxymethylenebutenolidase